MRDDAKVQHAAAKRKEFDERQLDKRRRKDEKKEAKRAEKRKAEDEADDSGRGQRGDEQDGATPEGADMEVEKQADECVVEMEEVDVCRWICELKEDEDDEVELGESFQQLDPGKVAEART